MLTRRSFLEISGGAITSLIVPRCVPIGGGNGGGNYGGNSGGSINPEDFTEPNDFLYRSEVDSILSQLESRIAQTGVQDYPLFLSQARDPPHVAGNYEIVDGLQLVPVQGPFATGNLRWFDQTSEGHIRTDYNQFLGNSTQAGFSSLGEIIRGERQAYSFEGDTVDVFTIYSLMHSTTSSGAGGCGITSAVILDGFIGEEEGIKAGLVNYVTAPLSDTGCGSYATAGAFIFIEEGYGYLLEGKAKESKFSRLIEGFGKSGANKSVDILGRERD